MNRHNGHSGNFPESDSSNGRSHAYDRSAQSSTARRSRPSSVSYNADPGAAPDEPSRPSVAIDVWSLLRPASKRWYWLIFGGLMGGIAGVALGSFLWTTYYSATAQIMHQPAPVATDAYQPQNLNGSTLVGMIKSPEIQKRLAQKRAEAGLGGAGTVIAEPERNSEIVTVRATGMDPNSAIGLANLHNAEVIEFTREHQRKEAEEADGYVATELVGAEKQLLEARGKLPYMPAGVLPSFMEPGGSAAGTANSATSVAALQKLSEQVEAAENLLAEKLARFTDAHPEVRQQRALLAELQTRLQIKADAMRGSGPVASAGGGSTPGGALAGGAPVSRDEWELAYINVRNLDNLVAQLRARQRAIQLFKVNPPGHFKVLQSANTDTVEANRPTIKVALLGAFFGLLGLVAAAGELLRRELFDTRLKTDADAARVTGLPVLATLGDLRRMSLAAREAWAFRAWIALQDRLAYSPNHGLICGITSSNSGDGRSTWINLLAGAARKCGFRVLTIATRPTADAPATEEVAEPAQAAAEPAMAGTRASRAEAAHAGGNGHANGSAASAVLTRPEEFSPTARSFASDSDFTALTASALFTPAMVTEKLMGTESDPLVHIPLPGWTWNLERRKQWQGALNVWRKIDNVVILVELPPASMPESVLLASNLPNLLWLVESGKSDAGDTRAQLQTLRHARCNLVGTVINRALAPVAGGRFSRWMGCLAFLAVLGMSGQNLVAADAVPTTQTQANAAFSVVSATQRAQWQQKLTLGAGDVLNLSIYGDPEATRTEVPIGPDGRISYLEANNVMAAGLTVDELREALNQELSKFRRAPQAFVVPVSYNSKKYFVLGKVAQRGAFPLNRPMTLVEAVAQAGGMETGLAADRSMIELADLSQSFVMRNNRRLAVDFEKLFAQGDLSQNVPLEPNDYIYFPAAGEKMVYVLGAVGTPGAYVYNNTTGALGAISARGGFNDRAWKKKVLVIRGGLGRPETFELDATTVLTAQAPDLKLQPKDIVYVSERPWIRGEELLEAAANAFVTSAVVTWTGEKITR